LLSSVKITSIISSSLTQWTLNPSQIHLFLLHCGFSDVKVMSPSPFWGRRNVLCGVLIPKPVDPSSSEANDPYRDQSNFFPEFLQFSQYQIKLQTQAI
jgi:hypothetical protein